jgi:hypothetical protein
MKRLSLSEVKSRKTLVTNLESIKGGTVASCHAAPPKTAGGGGISDPK